MCTAIEELIADGRAEGKAKIITNMVKLGMAGPDIRIGHLQKS